MINILVGGVNKTDMRLRNDKNIHSVPLDNGVAEIWGEKVGFINSGGGSFCGCISLAQIAMPASVSSIEYEKREF